MLREQRINIANPVLSEDPEGNRRRLKVVLYARSHSLSRPVSLAYVLSRSRALLCSTTTFAHALSLSLAPHRNKCQFIACSSRRRKTHLGSKGSLSVGRCVISKVINNVFYIENIYVSSWVYIYIPVQVGGMKDDVVICLQLGVFYSKSPHLYAA